MLEPGCGAGIFLGLAPERAELVGVELDPTSAGIARALYPQADVRAESFAATRLADGYFDVAIGNVRSLTCGCTTRAITRAGTACTTTSSSRRCT